jgi:undecaprenyl diphosphate synthase
MDSLSLESVGGGAIPQHIAIIMDGNGRWAKQRYLPRIAGHQKGVDTVRTIIESCLELGVRNLTLFAFSNENWKRPEEEVSLLMRLFVSALEQEIAKLHENGIRFRVIGDTGRFDPYLVELIGKAQSLTRDHDRLTLTLAINYGGRWDVMQAVNCMLSARPRLASGFAESDLVPYLSLSDAPEPDLFIRTGGEQRISNFLLWQLAYTELYFTDTLWPDFDRAAFFMAIQSYQGRERRFGRTSEQLNQNA